MAPRKAGKLEFALLGSGSKGNATLVRHGETCLMVDCGFSKTETSRRLARLGLEPGDVTAIFVTHEHSDHIGGVDSFSRKFGTPVFLTAGTNANAGKRAVRGANLLRIEQPLVIGDIEVTPVPVPHDAREPAQYVFDSGQHRLGVLTDLGRLTPHVVQQYSGLDAFILEANHDEAMLANGPYPQKLKDRVGGGLGHLSNRQSAELLDMIDCSKLQHLVAAHISEHNNTNGHAREALAGALGCESDWVQVACQVEGLGWRQLA
ncbi:MAG: MBL fold metallo-hydrolase [Gammaproteobacteria bacterium]|nr:MBL fold metallo-hydrolase [Gammaproteobacteria bacterium]